MPLQIFGDFSSVSGISPVIKNSYNVNINHSLSSFGHSETSFHSRAGGSLSHINQSTPSLKPPTVSDVPEDQQDLVSASHKEASSGAKSSEISHSRSSLKVPVRDISSPYNSLTHTGGTDYQATSSMAEANKVLEVSLSIPDQSDGTPTEDSGGPSQFKKQHENDGYFSPTDENKIGAGNLTAEDQLASSLHSDEEQHLLGDVTGEIKSTKTQFYEKLTFEKKLSAGQLV